VSSVLFFDEHKLRRSRFRLLIQIKVRGRRPRRIQRRIIQLNQ